MERLEDITPQAGLPGPRARRQVSPLAVFALLASLLTACHSAATPTEEPPPPNLQLSPCGGELQVQVAGRPQWLPLEEQIILETGVLMAAQGADGGRLCTADGSVLDLAPGATVAVGPTDDTSRLEIALQEGNLLLRAVEPAYQLVLPSCLVNLSEAPARISLTLRAGTTHLQVEEGRGTCTTETETIALEPGSDILAAPGVEPEIGSVRAERPPSATPLATPGASSPTPTTPSSTPVTPTSTPFAPTPEPTAKEVSSLTPAPTPTSTPSSEPAPSSTPTPTPLPPVFVPTDTSPLPPASEANAAATVAAASPLVAAPVDPGQEPGTISVYVYHDVNADGSWNWGDTSPPNIRGDHSWRWDYPSTHPGTAGETGEIGLVGARVALTYRSGERHVERTFHDGAAQFAVPASTEVTGVDFLGGNGGQLWQVTNVSQKTVNEPADEQIPLHLPLSQTGPNSMHVLLVGVAEYGGTPTGHPGSASAAYTIQPGDTLRGIAQAFGTTVEALASANGIADPDLIYAGSTITIP